MLAPSQIHGIIPPIVTPLERDGATVSEEGAHRLIDFLLEHGVHGLFVAGTTGEAAALDDTQWQRLVRSVVAANRGRVPVIAGVSTATTAGAVRRASVAAELGADAIVATIPYYYPPTQAEIVAHYQAIAQATALPLLLYNIPQHTQVNIAYETYLELAATPNIIGMKDSSGDVTEFRRILHAVRAGGRDFRMLLGTDTLTDVAILIGAQGAVASLANVAPGVLVATYNAAVAGRWAESAEHQIRAQALTDIYRVAWEAGSSLIGGIKCALAIMGVDCGPLAAPVRALTREERHQIEAILRAGRLLQR